MIVPNAAGLASFGEQKMGKASLGAGEHLYVGLNGFEAGQEHAAHTHADQDKLYVVLEGRAEATVGGEKSTVGPGAVILARAGVVHSMRNPGPGRLVVLVVFSPPPAGKS
jgi:quercetin dioxygenase-like cupin family protein